MSQSKPSWTDEQVEQTLGGLLRTGVLVAAGVVFVGGIVYLARHGLEDPPDYSKFRGEPGNLRSPGGIVHEALELRGRGLIQLGLLLLLATPVARVLFSVYAFARQRDYTYVLLTLVVLAVLVYSLFLGSP